MTGRILCFIFGCPSLRAILPVAQDKGFTYWLMQCPRCKTVTATTHPQP